MTSIQPARSFMKLCVIALGAFAWTAASAATPPAVEVAKVNGRPITTRDMNNALMGYNEGQRANLLKDPNSRRQVLSQLIEQEVLASQAEKEKIDQDADFKEIMAGFRKQLLSNRLLMRSLQSKVTEASAKAYYNKNKLRYSTDEVHVQHILATDEAKAREILKAVKAPDADFMAIAEKQSADPSAKDNRGDLGIVRRDSPFAPEFKNAAFAGAKGDIVGPVKTEYGYHLVKVVDKKLGRILNYEEVELQVKEALRAELAREYVNSLKAQAKIAIDDKALDKF